MRARTVDLMLLGTVLLWALNATVTRYVLTHGFQPLAYATIRYAIATGLFWVFTWSRERSFRIAPRDLRYIAIAASMICTADRAHQAPPFVSACPGDSGGPVIVQTPGGPVQLGVTSWGEETMEIACGQRALPDVAMRVSSFSAFINQANPVIQPYTTGGPTTQTNGRLACPHHNHARHPRPPP